MKLDRLRAQLMISGLQQKDPTLFQVIDQLINNLSDIYGQIIAGTIGGGALDDKAYLTSINESGSLPNSRQLLAGDGILFNDSVFGKRTVSNELSDETILTQNDETGVMPNSRRLAAGTRIGFDISVPGILTINEIEVQGHWTPMTDGNYDETDLIFANGDAIMMFIPS